MQESKRSVAIIAGVSLLLAMWSSAVTAATVLSARDATANGQELSAGGELAAGGEIRTGATGAAASATGTSGRPEARHAPLPPSSNLTSGWSSTASSQTARAARSPLSWS